MTGDEEGKNPSPPPPSLDGNEKRGGGGGGFGTPFLGVGDPPPPTSTLANRFRRKTLSSRASPGAPEQWSACRAPGGDWRT